MERPHSASASQVSLTESRVPKPFRKAWPDERKVNNPSPHRVSGRDAQTHAVRGGYTYAAMTDIAAILDDDGYRHAVDRLWKDVVGSKLYITGSSATAQFHDEGFGEPYHLPNETSYCETCSTISNVLWSHRMALLHKDASYVDVLERALYNGVLSGISLSGDHYFHTNPPASRGGIVRQPGWNPACCQSNLVRIIPQVGSMAYATAPDAVYVNLFVNGEANLKMGDATTHLRMETDYPRDGRVRITVLDAARQPFTIAVRIPGWAREQPVPSGLCHFTSPTTRRATVSVAGAAAAPARPEHGYVRFKRTWQAGDVIELKLPMPVRRVLADDRVKADQGRVGTATAGSPSTRRLPTRCVSICPTRCVSHRSKRGPSAWRWSLPSHPAPSRNGDLIELDGHTFDTLGPSRGMPSSRPRRAHSFALAVAGAAGGALSLFAGALSLFAGGPSALAASL